VAKKRRKMKEIAKDIKANRIKPGRLITRAEWLVTVIKLTQTGIEEGDGNGMLKQAERFEKELKGLIK
jgi:hypothetical protein